MFYYVLDFLRSYAFFLQICTKSANSNNWKCTKTVIWQMIINFGDKKSYHVSNLCFCWYWIVYECAVFGNLSRDKTSFKYFSASKIRPPRTCHRLFTEIAFHACVKIISNKLTNLPIVSPPTIKYSPSWNIADRKSFLSFKSPILSHWLFLNWAMVDLYPPPHPPIIYAAESVDAVA